MIAPAPRKPIPRHDLRGDARRVGRIDAGAAREELPEAVRGDDREQRRAERDEQVRAQPGLPVAQLALEADRAAEHGREREPEERRPSRERRDASREEHRSLRAGAARAPRCPRAARSSSPSSRSRSNGTRSAVACTSTSRPSPVMTTFMSTSARRVLRVVEVEQRLAVDDADRDRGDRARERLREPEAVERALRRDVRAADRGAARAAVGLEDVAVEPDRPLAERLEVDDRAHRAADQPLDLDRPPALLAARGLALGALAGRRRAGASTRRSSSRGPSRAASAARPPRSTPCRGRASCPATRAPSRAAARGSRVDDLERPQLVGPAPVLARHAAACSSSATATLLDLADRQLEEPRAELAEELRRRRS